MSRLARPLSAALSSEPCRVMVACQREAAEAAEAAEAVVVVVLVVVVVVVVVL
jgi:hypothetical protein